MSRKGFKKAFRCSSYTAESMLLAYQSVRLGIYTGRRAAEKFNVPYGTLNKKLSGRAPVEAHGAGRPIEISAQNEEKFAEYLFISGKYGYGYSKCEIKNLVAEFVKEEEIKTRWADGKPGYEWLKNFLKRHPEVYVRKEENISNKRLDGMDPFAVFKFYNDIEVLFEHEKLILSDAHRIFNVAKISFDDDVMLPFIIPSKCSACISKAAQCSKELGVSAVVCVGADGTKLHPLIVFRGRCVLPPLVANKNLPKTSYYTASARKWKEGELFSHWFENVFIPQISSITARHGRSVILLFDGNSLRINIRCLTLAVKHNIIFVKLPPFLNDFLQPLNKMCLSALKSGWNDQLFFQKQGNLATIQKLFGQVFGIIWSQHFRKNVVRKAFRTTGIFPPDRNKFPVKIFSQSALKRYFDKYQRPVKFLFKSKKRDFSTEDVYDPNEEHLDPIYDESNFPATTDNDNSESPIKRLVLKKIFSGALSNSSSDLNPKRKKISRDCEDGFVTEIKQEM
ncbi:DDE-1 domain-containing protein [Trichonephila clavata]|uniref:DDE-1 domain-containing protein n=1 Tax=Trichonephila clavata TaxID=2740835 RepID=A0A8X6HC37_TRICU|nr:DDE-1 domain-containing protein [Trichonephila clavata]